ncbi:MAG: class I SAM-dependent methyltransferase [Syntrophales bacterium]|jgi:SAM-dependent methyltransferase|nr:class I SAM-dependent methyltransferase [Syntrophales bacterium]MCK9528250.1 class I SAM-dependent methyltransferase [Syntrophales bacterium]MDX9922381.1 class I SAM-dependent methyltransferase [Syntrophales bacterium]
MNDAVDAISSYEAWQSSPEGRYVHKRIYQLLTALLNPQGGERLLDVGCKTGHALAFFRARGFQVTGMETSRPVLDAARRRMEGKASLHLGALEDLPFSDNEFDVVTMIASLESTRDPYRALSEAVRVSNGRVCLGLFNRTSLSAHRLRVSGIPGKAVNSFGIFETMRMARGILSNVPVDWGSVIFFPLRWYPHAETVESRVPMMKNPFGSFAALSFPVIYTHRTLQEPIGVKPPATLRESGRVAGTACKTRGGLL